MLVSVAAYAVLAAHCVFAQTELFVPMPLGDFVSEDGLKEWFEKLAAEGKELRAPLLSMDRLTTGQVGWLPYAFDPASPTPFVTTSVMQVIDEGSCLLRVQTYRLTRSLTRTQFRDVVGPINPEKDREYFVWTNMNTVDLADDVEIKLRGAWKVSGTKSYETNDGKRTVHVIESTKIAIPKPDDPDIARIKEEVAREKEDTIRAEEESKQAAVESERKSAEDARIRRIKEREELLTRDWEDTSGKFKIRARLTAVLPGSIARLMKADGSTVEVAV